MRSGDPRLLACGQRRLRAELRGGPKLLLLTLSLLLLLLPVAELRKLLEAARQVLRRLAGR